MAIDLGSSSDDLKSMKSRETKPDYEDGFGPDDGFDDFDFGDLGSFDFSDSSSGSSFGDSSFGGSSFGGDSFGGSSFGGSSFGSSQPATPPKKDAVDVGMELSIIAFGAAGRVFVQFIKSVKSKNLQDVGELSKNMIMAGIGLAGGGIITAAIGIVTTVKAFDFTNLPLTFILSGVNILGTGLIGVVGAARIIEKKGLTYTQPTISNSNASFGSTSSFGSDSSFGDDFDFGDDSSDTKDEDDFDFDFEEDDDFDFSSIVTTSNKKETKKEPIVENVSEKLVSVPENIPILSRQFLYDTFKPFFNINNPEFSNRSEISSGSDLFDIIKLKCIKAIAAASNVDFNTLDVTKFQPDSISETLFTYEILIPRSKKSCKVADLEKEIVAYFNSDADDTSVSASVKVQGDFYKIVVYKGTSALITLGDILRLKESEEFFRNNDIKLPMCVGIAPNGQPVLRDAKIYDTMLIAGKPRSGKSWFTFNILVNFMAFNTPEDVQFIIIDPKNSALMNTLALMPHVAGFHTHEYIIEILEDLIDSEGKRREKLLLDHGCDDIWALRKSTNIKLPILYIFIDEYMTVMESFENADIKNKFVGLMKTIITNFPSKGIRLIFVPHRAQGVVDKNIRENISFAAAVKANEEVVKETLGIKKVGCKLVNPGDTAVMMTGDSSELYVKGNAICVDDDKNKELIKNMARAFYKMGFDQPDMTKLKSGFNRNEKKIKEQLTEDDTSVRLQISRELEDDDLELIDL